MAKYEDIKNLKNEDFRRLTGIKIETFNLMINCLKKEKDKEKRGTKSKISLEDKLLLELEYLRENRTFYHIAADYGINESTAIRISHWVEDILSKCKEFSLPSKRILQQSEMEYEVFVVDATETPIERPTMKSKKK